MGWFTAGRVTNPGKAAILADTGPMLATTLAVTVLAWVEREPATIEIAQRDAGNLTDVNVQTLSVDPAQSAETTFTATLQVNQRIVARCTQGLDISGDIHVSIFA